MGKMFSVSSFLLLVQICCVLGNLKEKVASLTEDGIDLLEQERQLIDKLKEQLEKAPSTLPPDASDLDILVTSASGATGATSTCHMLPSVIHITKEDVDESGSTVRTCEGDLQVNKCDGSCLSELRPSITSSTGFAKKCNCCREVEMKVSAVQLDNCYDPDGIKLTESDKATMVVKVKEPSSCSCRPCGV